MLTILLDLFIISSIEPSPDFFFCSSVILEDSMKKAKFILLAVLLIIAISAFLSKAPIIFLHMPLVEAEKYNSPEEAIIKTLNTTEFKMVGSNNTFLAVCNTKVNTYNCQYIFKNNGGWSVVTEKMFANAYFHHKAKDNIYNIFVRKYSDKYAITVVQDEYSMNNNDLLYVEDSINSEFEEIEHTNVFNEHFWYICLDDIPDNYTITVSDDSGHNDVVSIR